jgi:rubredoxin
MSDILRAFSAVFRYLPSKAGDIRMIHNGEIKTEVGIPVEQLWFSINNRRSVAELYGVFLDIIEQPDNNDSRETFAAILMHFQLCGYVEISLREIICAVCGWRLDPLVGDIGSGISPGVTVDRLPKNWSCPDCRAGKTSLCSIA